jgi:hypothetical protein
LGSLSAGAGGFSDFKKVQPTHFLIFIRLIISFPIPLDENCNVLDAIYQSIGPNTSSWTQKKSFVRSRAFVIHWSCE